MKPQTRVLPDSNQLIIAATEQFVSTARNAIAKRGVFYVALAGGSTPKGLYQQLAQSPYRDQVDWQRVHFFFGDERCVPADHDDSNFKMARLAMLDALPVPDSNVHRMPTELGEAKAVAVAYAETIKQTMQSAPFDLVLLGLGPDGHIASLFPDTPALTVTDTITTDLYVEKFDSWRVTLTYAVINAARQVIVFIAGEAKAAIVHDITTQTVTGLPVQKLAPSGDYYWYMDQAASGQ
ncbi:6-phosphogluconolactonase, eukaryotic type [Methylophaga frappieri]|uniref:6-phosphogluconolactonase n=1 Tax=Methylophaga frappieri (strain ATCC BAA-2434 / DSM 25690 / JAM7) TaxID=754477 RepID=I1YHN7_METFJ|nr:6-phosphogluconolactonase [Methylophaga frappieri]AFJ02430.1 6-phosphogluconolactonase, eukaryotic type [Methylophaga frappieri]